MREDSVHIDAGDSLQDEKEKGRCDCDFMTYAENS